MEKKLICNLSILKYLLPVFFALCICGCGTISDREYTVSVILTGGSGRAYVESPCTVTVKDGKTFARIRWSSPNYDYMIVDGETYYPVNEGGNSEFVIPVTPGEEMSIQADTTAMSTPHLIEYTLLVSKEDASEAADGAVEGGLAEMGERSEAMEKKASLLPPQIEDLDYVSTDENEYAECFKIHRYEGNFVVVSVEDGRNYLIVPEGGAVPKNIGAEVMVLQSPVDRIYLAASGAACHFDSLGCVDRLILSGIEESDWYIDSVADAMKSGSLVYGGKYSAPDYEQIVMEDIDLAVENTMLLHVPKVQEKLEQIGIPVFIDRSSYEKKPLGRCEWVKVYGVVLGKEREAENAFEEQKARVEAVDLRDVSGKSVVFFYLNSNHQIVTRSGNDYFSRMIEMAGGEYLTPENEGEDAASQMTISIEAFYSYASDADILIYNSTIDAAPGSLDELMNQDATFSDFKAFKEGNVWYTDKALYQYSDKTGTIISDLADVISVGKEETTFFHKLK